MAARGAVGGFVVTSGSFSGDAREFVRGRNVKLIDGQRLFSLIQQARTSLAASDRTPDDLARQQPKDDDWTPAPGPTCQSCGADMVRRTAKKGPNAGQAFWGCSTYPACRGIRPIG